MIEKTKLPLAAFVADNATVRGHVTAGKGSSIYFGAVIRSESDTTAIGEDTNIQDNCVPVSYTHLDVYKRQGGRNSGAGEWRTGLCFL